MNYTKIKVIALFIAIITFASVLLSFVFSYALIKDITTLELSEIPDGQLLRTSDSFDGRYTLRVSKVSLNALSQFGYKGEIVDNSSGYCKTIYFEYPISHPTVEITWTGKRIVSINGILLDIEKDTYDSRCEQ